MKVHSSGDSVILSKGFAIISPQIQLHSVLKGGLEKIYGWTSDDGGIRHALMEGDTPPTFADAKFMLVACSALMNYLTTKAAENGLDINL